MKTFEHSETNQDVKNIIMEALTPLWLHSQPVPAGAIDTSATPYTWIALHDNYFGFDPDWRLNTDCLCDAIADIINLCKKTNYSGQLILDPMQMQYINRALTKNNTDNMCQLVTGLSKDLDIALVARFDENPEQYEKLQNYVPKCPVPLIAKKICALEAQLERVGGELRVRKADS